ncbi:MAG: acyltransferase family protein [Solirubrobacteraceae bacterium]
MSGSASPRRRVELTRHRGLDGLRGIAVIAVLLYHGGVPWASGGFLGVEVFFVLSGFLITSLLVAEWTRTGTIALGAFWARRARRLLPALFAVVAAIGVYYALAGPEKAVPGFLGDGLSTLLYFSNWHQIAAGTNYFAASGPVSPFQHTWSLAIEEQFYLVWPLLLLAIVTLAGLRRAAGTRRSLQLLLGLSLTCAAGSAVEMAVLYDGGRGLDRVYYGTDTRAASLLLGASLGFALAIARRRPEHARRRFALGPRGRRALGVASPAVLAAVAVAVHSAAGPDGWLYPYGLLGLDGCVLALIAAVVVMPDAPAARILALAPLRAVGEISYGLYLWHFPLFQWLDESSTGQTGARLLALRLGVTLAVSLVSFVVIEQPIRRRRLPTWLVQGLTPVAAGAATTTLLLASAAAALPAAVPAAAKLPAPAASLRGTDPACRVTLADTKQVGLSPVPAAKEAKFEYTALGQHALTWSGSSTATFQTCPPKRVLLIGDSIAFTIGVPLMSDEQRYGVELANGAILGCSFSAKGQLDVNGTWEGLSAGCPDALSTWSREEQATHAQEVVVELGYRDEFDWRIDGRVVHLGQPAFDRYVQAQIDRYVAVLGRGGVKVVFLTVPYTDPPAQADGSPAPAASASRHTEINAMLQAAARRYPKTVSVLDIDTTLSPGNHYDAKVNGQLCRFDGIHVSVYCAELLGPSVLGEVRRTLG